MRTDSPTEFHIYIDSLEGIFGDPFSSVSSKEIGKESAMDQLKRHIDEELPIIEEKKAVIHIASLADSNAHEVVQAIHRYCDNKIEMNEHLIKHTRKRGRRLFWKILLIGVICLILAALIAAILPRFSLPPVIQTFLTGGLAIIAWVMLWDPIEMIVYGPSDYKRENRVYREIKKLEITLSR